MGINTVERIKPLFRQSPAWKEFWRALEEVIEEVNNSTIDKFLLRGGVPLRLELSMRALNMDSAHIHPIDYRDGLYRVTLDIEPNMEINSTIPCLSRSSVVLEGRTTIESPSYWVSKQPHALTVLNDKLWIMPSVIISNIRQDLEPQVIDTYDKNRVFKEFKLTKASGLLKGEVLFSKNGQDERVLLEWPITGDAEIESMIVYFKTTCETKVSKSKKSDSSFYIKIPESLLDKFSAGEVVGYITLPEESITLNVYALKDLYEKSFIGSNNMSALLSKCNKSLFEIKRLAQKAAIGVPEELQDATTEVVNETIRFTYKDTSGSYSSDNAKFESCLRLVPLSTITGQKASNLYYLVEDIPLFPQPIKEGVYNDYNGVRLTTSDEKVRVMVSGYDKHIVGTNSLITSTLMLAKKK